MVFTNNKSKRRSPPEERQRTWSDCPGFAARPPARGFACPRPQPPAAPWYQERSPPPPHTLDLEGPMPSSPILAALHAVRKTAAKTLVRSKTAEHQQSRILRPPEIGQLCAPPCFVKVLIFPCLHRADLQALELSLPAPQQLPVSRAFVCAYSTSPSRTERSSNPCSLSEKYWQLKYETLSRDTVRYT